MNKKILIAYFSHEGEAYVSGKIMPLPVGNTRVAADMIKELTGADVFRIEAAQPYPYGYRETIDIAKKELQTAARPTIQGELPDVKNYDVLILGYPNWWGTFPMIVATFLESRDFSGKVILPLCTNEGSGMGDSEPDLKKLCPGAVVKPGLPITGGQINGAQPKMEAWLRANGIVE
jgi:flavodoxin